MLITTICSVLLILISLLPFIQNKHWVFRTAEFIKLQLLPLQVIAVVGSLFFVENHSFLWYIQGIQISLIGYHFYILLHYSKFWKTPRMPSKAQQAQQPIKVISCNVYQFNRDHQRFIDLITREKPDIFLTMESNAAWEKAMRPLEKEYPNFKKVTLENTYGMHFYTKLELVSPIQTHFFVANDLPSIEAELATANGQQFTFFGIHPPPPSPTEEETSEERDGDILSLAKRIKKMKTERNPVIVTGDFNTVAWAKSSRLFRKTSQLIDARIGRAVLSTFHTKYWFYRVPLDLLFHSPKIFVKTLSTYPSIGSDHFPLGFTFFISKAASKQDSRVEHLEKDELEDVNEAIKAGKQAQSSNRSAVTSAS